MSKPLVVYFSASSGRVTEKLAEKLARAIGADLYEIRPATPYTEADLDWNDRKSRSTVEMNDLSARPAIAGALPDTGAYSTVFVGFPVWWYREPSIIDTFLEGCDLNGKTVVPFATSGSSPIGDSGKHMQRVAKTAAVAAGRRFAASASEQELADWAKEWL